MTEPLLVRESIYQTKAEAILIKIATGVSAEEMIDLPRFPPMGVFKLSERSLTMRMNKEIDFMGMIRESVFLLAILRNS